MAGAVALVGSSGCLGFDLAVFFLGSLGKLETGIMGVDFSRTARRKIQSFCCALTCSSV
jgi:hypothetical protein